MASNSFLLLFVATAALVLPQANSQLTLDYYSKTCPDYLDIIQDHANTKYQTTPVTAAGTVRVFFHDCVVGGCDASVLISSNAFNKAERDSDLDKSLPGDAFDIITSIKSELELKCPGVVSCADILALATRSLIVMAGGPNYEVLLGRKDGLVSRASDVEGHIARPNMTMDNIIKIFQSKGFSVQEMVALVGAHTFGFANCDQFMYRLYNWSKDSQFDPAYNPQYALALQKLCSNHSIDPSIAGFLDVLSPKIFDNIYYKGLQKGLGLLESDSKMATDPRTKPFVDLYAANITVFYHDFAEAIQKVGTLNVLTGNQGEVRRRCDAFNNVQVP